MSIVLVASEALPFAKTGGLADVAGALPRALAHLGHRVTLIVPRYRGIDAGKPAGEQTVVVGGEARRARYSEHSLEAGARVIFVDEPALFDREALYGIGANDYPDNAKRFAFFSRAALAWLELTGERPDVVHAHDWQTGLVPVYLRTRYAGHLALGGVPTVFTIHNLAYQGLFPPEVMPTIDLGWDLFTMDGVEFWGRVSFLKAGITFSDTITTVSPRYAQQILTPEFGFGFEGILAARRADLIGILNGIDTTAWNPMTDPFLEAPYSADDLSGKRENKRALLAGFGLPADEETLRRPVVGMISRQVDQKGLDLIARIADQLPHLGATFTVLGSGERRYEDMWRSLAAAYPDRFGVRIGFDEALAHRIEAGADLFLMPSRFEPCGLNQMYSLRYGTLPLVRATGGLDDSVENFDPVRGTGTGFKFWDYTPEALLGTLRWALGVYEHPSVWQELQRAGMRRDFSWDASAREYVKAYLRARERAQATSAPPPVGG